MSGSVAAPLVVNKRELSRLLRTSVVSLGNWIEKWSDFPVVERGTNGREWRFDPPAVVEFLRAKKEQERRQERELGESRDAALSQMTLPLSLLGDDQRPPAPGTSLKDQKAALELRVAQRKEAEALGRLVACDEVRDAITIAFATMSRVLSASIRSIGHDHNLPPAILRSLQTRITSAQRDAIRAIGEQLAGDEIETSAEIEARSYA